MTEKKLERLQKVIAQAGISSRRKAEELILTGRVQVNQVTVRILGTKVGLHDQVSVDGVPVEGREKLVYYLLNKPRGVVTTNHDDKDRPTVVGLLDNISERVYPVGRLDYDTTGVLLLTNDGTVANELMHPKKQVDKVYLAKVKGLATDEQINPLRNGIMLNGRKTAPARASIQRWDKTKNTTMVEVVIHEGRNHQVKEMLSKVGFPVIKLTRQRYAFLDLTGLQPGEYRSLTHEEVKRLKNHDYRNLRRK